MRPARLVVPLVVAGLAAIAGCSARLAEDPSFLLVELDAFAGDLGTPHAARIALLHDKTPVTSPFCVKLAKPGATTPASFVLRRDFGKDPGQRVTIVVTAFDALVGDAAVEDGRELVCPPTLPPPLGEAQKVSVDFCNKKAEKLVFHVGRRAAAATPRGQPTGACMMAACITAVRTEGTAACPTAEHRTQAPTAECWTQVPTAEHRTRAGADRRRCAARG